VLGGVAGGGNNLTVQTYRFTDFAIKTPATYYRIRQEDHDGKFSYSAVIRIDARNIQDFSVAVSPNPVKDKAVATITMSRAAAVMVQLVDGAGRVVYAIPLSLQAGTTKVPLNMTGERPGMYFLRITDGTGGGLVLPLVKK
jgi:hypothetical protein